MFQGEGVGLAEGGDGGKVELVLRLHDAIVMAATEESVSHKTFDLQLEEVVVESAQAVGGSFLHTVAHYATTGGEVNESVEDSK